jgi:hypothetical protein
MNGVHKFQVDAIKTSNIRMFTDNPILFRVWLSSTEMWGFLICTRLVIISSLHLHQIPHLFFPNSNIWWRCWTSTCDEVGIRSSHSLSLLVSPLTSQSTKSYAKCLYSNRTTCLFYNLHRHWWCRRKNVYLPVITSTRNYGRIFSENPDLDTSFRCRDWKCIRWWRSW